MLKQEFGINLSYMRLLCYRVGLSRERNNNIIDYKYISIFLLDHFKFYIIEMYRQIHIVVASP